MFFGESTFLIDCATTIIQSFTMFPNMLSETHSNQVKIAVPFFFFFKLDGKIRDLGHQTRATNVFFNTFYFI